MQTLVVHKRWGDESEDVREFVRPDAWAVWQQAEILNRGNPPLVEYLHRCLNFVRTGIRLAPGPATTMDWHRMQAYGNPFAPILRYSENDFWNYPSETLDQKIGDCDDKSILLVSLLRRRYRAKDVFCSVGLLGDVGHMWVSLVGTRNLHVVETTTEQPLFLEVPPYSAYYRFNDKEVMLTKPQSEIPMLHERRGV